MNNPIICAIDTKDIQQAKELCISIKENVGMVKCGLEFFTKNGPQGIKEIASTGIDIFLDLKFHDIPNTVAQAVRSAISLDVGIITIHTLGGKDMMLAASQAATEESAQLGKKLPIIVGVTVLTSMDETDLQEIAINQPPAKQVTTLAKLAKDSGLDGIVCSPHEIELVKASCGDDFVTVVPGIRPEASNQDDQKRTMTPKQAIEKGANYLVIGRPITKAELPSEAAANILAGIR